MAGRSWNGHRHVWNIRYGLTIDRDESCIVVAQHGAFVSFEVCADMPALGTGNVGYLAGPVQLEVIKFIVGIEPLGRCCNSVGLFAAGHHTLKPGGPDR